MLSDALVKAVLRSLQNDPHQWSVRPCSTCQAVTSIVGEDFGCVVYAKGKVKTKTFTVEEVVEVVSTMLTRVIFLATAKSSTQIWTEADWKDEINDTLQEKYGTKYKCLDHLFEVMEVK